MKKFLSAVVLATCAGFANANLMSPAHPLSPLNPVGPLNSNNIYLDDEEDEKPAVPDKKEARQVYIHKVKKMTGSYSHTWFYDYKTQKYLMQKTSNKVKAKTKVNVTYNITKHHYEL